ncbi:MAG: hypothetical protein SXQ77_13155 [Halobacteria archaeon]|nr:hypothetical protein [Halobacteria archaeon]
MVDASRLMDFLHDEIGDSLRFVVHNHPEKVRVVYSRNDLEDKYDTDELDRLAEEWSEGKFRKKFIEDIYKYESLDYIVLKFKEALIVTLFPEPEKEEGIAISVDSDVDLMPSHFVNECLSQLGKQDGELEEEVGG